MLRPSLCDYGEMYMFGKRTITVSNTVRGSP